MYDKEESTIVKNFFESNQDRLDSISEAIDHLTLAEAFILYSHLQERLKAPKRLIQAAENHELRITFQNRNENFTDNSLISCVFFILHGMKSN